ncbi:MAG: four-carbon acid sugar kinase family protein [Planctomycetota bacterium]|nr:four-carbon acid sugar kinase family protein [Planctomycetota bacterium]
MKPFLGCIADDFTGATDLANMLVRGGMRVVQYLGTPDRATPIVDDVEAVVIALKSRSVPPAEAINLSLKALESLKTAGVRRFYFKYCSTFDSTDAGNIGPVAEAMMDALGVDQTIVCPAFPENGRTVYLGHLFVHGQLLNESGMANHPLTPMKDANLVRVLQRQSRRRVGLLSITAVANGPDAIVRGLSEKSGREELVITDAFCERHLRDIANAVAGMMLVTGGSGIARGLPDAYRRRGELSAMAVPDMPPRMPGFSAVLAGSCSEATRRQVKAFRAWRPAIAIDPISLFQRNPGTVVQEALAKIADALPSGPVLLYTTAAPHEVAAHQQQFGSEAVAHAVEQALGAAARGLIHLGVCKLVVAGGETAGAVLSALGVRALRIGSQIEPGVPWTYTQDAPQLALALKSGNFGSEQFFRNALEMLP